MPYTRRERSASPQASLSPAKGRQSLSPAKGRQSLSPVKRRRSRSLSRSRRSRSRSPSVDASNPGNNLYVTGLSTRVTSGDVEKFFNKEGKVLDCHLVTDPRSRESRGFAFVTMETVEDAERCIKYLNRSVLEGRLVTVEKAKRKRGRTPTPGRYQGLRDKRDAGRDRGDRDRGDRDRDRDRGDRDRGDRSDRGRDRRRSRSYSPRRREDRDPPSRDYRGRSRSPNGRARRVDEHSDSYKRRRDHS